MTRHALFRMLVIGLLFGAGNAAYAQKEGYAAPAVAGGRDPQPMVTVPAHVVPNTPATDTTPSVANAAVSRGAYLARLGDCVACHTAPDGKPFAGGLALSSPIGTIYSSNITPDPKTGIGSYTFEDFDKAVRSGVGKGKGSLYPAMPYPSYARISEQDMKDLFAYFQSLTPIENAVPDNGIPWPLSMRWPLSIWRAVFAPDAAKVQANPAPTGASDAAVKARGAYLVEGLGHCGACHTPRTVTMQEKGLTSTDEQFLAGGNPMEGWVAKNLRGDGADGLARWSEQDIVAFLKTGRNTYTSVFGSMTDVVEHSSQYMNDADLRAIALYLKDLPAHAGAKMAPYAYNTTTADALWKGSDKQRGAALYIDSCNACHRSDGKGYQDVFPALAGNSVVLSDDPVNLISIILHGHQVPATATRPSTFTMPAFGWRLNDSEVADVATFVRSSWGNQASAVTAEQVKKLRDATSGTAARPATAPRK